MSALRFYVQDPALPQIRLLLVHLQHDGFHSSEHQDIKEPDIQLITLQRLVTYYMINYYIKYLELLDTGFLVLKKKPLGKLRICGFDMEADDLEAFLHVFHHAATAVLCFTQLEGATSVVSYPLRLNLGSSSLRRSNGSSLV